MWENCLECLDNRIKLGRGLVFFLQYMNRGKGACNLVPPHCPPAAFERAKRLENLFWPNFWCYTASTRDDSLPKTLFTSIESTKDWKPDKYKDLRKPYGQPIQCLHTVPNAAPQPSQLAPPKLLSLRSPQQKS